MSREELLQVGFNIPNKDPSVNADHDVADPTSHAQFKVKWLKGPPEPSKSDFGRFWAILALFGLIHMLFIAFRQHKTVRKSGHFPDISSSNLQTLKTTPYEPV